MTSCSRRRAALAAAALFAGCGGGPEAPAFDSALAHSLVERQVAFGPRVPGTPAHTAARDWLVEYLGARADAVAVDSFVHVTTRGDSLRLSNVLARFRPDDPSRILLVAHWDSRPVAERSANLAARSRPVPGGNDGASGVAVLLAIADALAADPPGVGVDILLTDGEDWGHDPVTGATEVDDMLLGARRYAATADSAARPLFGILLDLVGDDDPRFPMEGWSLQYAPEVVRRVWEVAADLGHDDVFLPTPGSAITDDHVPLNEAGIRTVDVIDLDYPFWHTVDDTADKVSEESLEIVGSVVLEVIRRQAP